MQRTILQSQGRNDIAITKALLNNNIILSFTIQNSCTCSCTLNLKV